jgi:hypothetical protein
MRLLGGLEIFHQLLSAVLDHRQAVLCGHHFGKRLVDLW